MTAVLLMRLESQEKFIKNDADHNDEELKLVSGSEEKSEELGLNPLLSTGDIER